jgi:hypothetical protein
MASWGVKIYIFPLILTLVLVYLNVARALPTFRFPITLSTSPPPPSEPVQSVELLVCLVVSFMSSTDPQKVHADSRTAAMYKRLPSVLPLLAKTVSSPDHDTYVWLREGHPHSSVLTNIKVNKLGTPLISSLFEQAEETCPASVPFIAYANADILFDSGLVDTLQMLKDWPMGRLMVVGRRSNLDMGNHHETSLDDILNAKGDLFRHDAQDYFITTRRLVDWSALPPYVIGRRAYDNALVDWGFHHATLVDATETIKATHQTLSDGNSAAHSTIHADKEYNANLPGGTWDHGSTSMAHYMTDHGSTSMAHYRTVVALGKGLVAVDQGGKQQWPTADAMRSLS